MPNHLHAIVQYPQDCLLKDWARAFKGGASQLIVRQYQVEGNQPALDALRRLVTRPNKQEFKIWEDGYLAKDVVTAAFLEEKLAYTHNNPVQPHRQLADVPEDYAWSSARFYLRDEPALIPVQDARELLI
jgi:REP element-mobilizing transposase RayT